MGRASAWAAWVALAMVMAGVGPGGVAMTVEDPFSNEDYDFLPSRTLTLSTPMGEYDKVAEAVRRLAEADGYKFRVGSPTGRPGSLIMDMWTRTVVVTGSGAPEADTLYFYVYWNGDVADDAALDRVAERLRAHLAPFGPIGATVAPPGTAPRER